MNEQLLAPLYPDDRALAPLLQKHIDDEMLREISRGSYNVAPDQCYDMLQEILRTGVAELQDFQLREALELTRWGPPFGGRRGSWMQIFACTCLLQMASRCPDGYSGECETLAPFVSSAIDLGGPVVAAAASVLAGRFLSYPGDSEDSAFLAVSILLLSLCAEGQTNRTAWLSGLAKWVEKEEAQVRLLQAPCRGTQDDSEADDDPVTQEWLLGLTPFRHFVEVWRVVARRILASPNSQRPPEADEILRRLSGPN